MFRIGLLLLAVLLVVTGCGTGDNQAERQAEAEGQPSANAVYEDDADAPAPSDGTEQSAGAADPDGSQPDNGSKDGASNEAEKKASLPLKPAVTYIEQGIVPVRIAVPAAGVDAPVDPVGLGADGEMLVPKDDARVGWYELGANPGAAGRAVLSGHVDNTRGPAVFFELKNLQPGDTIELTGGDGRQLMFEVYRIEAYPYDDAPIAEIFGPSSRSELVLITCTGVYNKRKRTHEERLVIYAAPVTTTAQS